MDQYERDRWEEIKRVRARLAAMLFSSDDFLTVDALDADAWGNAYVILSKAIVDLRILQAMVHKVRCRRLEAPIGSKPELPNG